MSSPLQVRLNRVQFVVSLVVYGVGFFAPWNRMVPAASSLSTWLVLAAEVGRQGWMSFTGATVLLLVVAIVLTLVAAAIRTWAVARRGGGPAQQVTAPDSRVHTGAVSNGGRPWLALGLMLHTLALAVLMPPAGAAFAVLAMVVLLVALRVVGGEVAPAVHGWAGSPAWGQAVLQEVYFWAVAASFAVLGWRYNAFLLQRAVVVSLGLGLVARALMPKQTPAA